MALVGFSVGAFNQRRQVCSWICMCFHSNYHRSRINLPSENTRGNRDETPCSISRLTISMFGPNQPSEPSEKRRRMLYVHVCSLPRFLRSQIFKRKAEKGHITFWVSALFMRQGWGLPVTTGHLKSGWTNPRGGRTLPSILSCVNVECRRKRVAANVATCLRICIVMM